jgi:protein gp37
LADRSAIEWTEATWNPVTGCSKVSPGCAHCYAETFAERWRGVPGHPYEQGFDLRLWPARLEQPLRWRRPRKIFVSSMSDLFHEAIPESFLGEIFDIMLRADHHIFQILTKREERMAELAPTLPWPDHVWMGVIGGGVCTARARTSVIARCSSANSSRRWGRSSGTHSSPSALLMAASQ